MNIACACIREHCHSSAWSTWTKHRLITRNRIGNRVMWVHPCHSFWQHPSVQHCVIATSRFGTKPPNLKTAYISSYTVPYFSPLSHSPWLLVSAVTITFLLESCKLLKWATLGKYKSTFHELFTKSFVTALILAAEFGMLYCIRKRLIQNMQQLSTPDTKTQGSH